MVRNRDDSRAKRAYGRAPGSGLQTNSPLRVACPLCLVAAYRPCVNIRQWLRPAMKTVHQARRDAARAARERPEPDS